MEQSISPSRNYNWKIKSARPAQWPQSSADAFSLHDQLNEFGISYASSARSDLIATNPDGFNRYRV
jgi:hypothetical protein